MFKSVAGGKPEIDYNSFGEGERETDTAFRCTSAAYSSMKSDAELIGKMTAQVLLALNMFCQ